MALKSSLLLQGEKTVPILTLFAISAASKGGDPIWPLLSEILIYEKERNTLFELVQTLPVTSMPCRKLRRIVINFAIYGKSVYAFNDPFASHFAIVAPFSMILALPLLGILQPF